jgi:DNA-binding beta-propeller fold protein YncE
VEPAERDALDRWLDDQIALAGGPAASTYRKQRARGRRLVALTRQQACSRSAVGSDSTVRMNARWSSILVAVSIGACSANVPSARSASAPAEGASAAPAPMPSIVSATNTVDPGAFAKPPPLESKAMPLPGATGTAFLDYIVYERANSRVWVPVGITGSVDVLDIASGTFERIDGFKTEEREVKGKKRTYGPSAAAVGDGFVYVGNRATSEICPIDVKTLKPRKCLKLAAASDGVAYVPSAKEVWVTTPKEQTLTVLDASKPGALALKTTVKTDGSPEGYAVDDVHGLFFTNLEDKGKAVVIDIKTHTVKAEWNANCSADGPRGIAFDAPHDFVIVACTDRVQVLDAGHDGAALGKLDTGGGIDNIDFVDGRHYGAAGKAATLTVATVDDKGQLSAIATGATSQGARNAVADANGNVYVADSHGARLLVFASAPGK